MLASDLSQTSQTAHLSLSISGRGQFLRKIFVLVVSGKL